MTSDRGNDAGAELQIDPPVTAKSQALNPNATVFLSKTPNTPDTGQWDTANSNTGTATDYHLANGDIDLKQGGVHTPQSESPLHNDEFSLPESLPVVPSVEQAVGQIVLAVEQVVIDTEEEANHVSVADGGDSLAEPIIIDTQAPVLSLVPDGSPPPALAPEMTLIVASDISSSDMVLSPDGVADTSMVSEVVSPDAALSDLPVDTMDVPETDQRQMLKTQLEIYFSRENLASDSYLQSQMDADQYVPITTVANLTQVARLTSNLDLIREVLQESLCVQVDEKGEKVRPNHNRCIVILREVPETTPVEDVEKLFSGENCPKFVSCEFAANNNWYVTFDSDDDAQRAYQYLREEVRCFLGKPIMARIKAKPLIRTAYVPRNGYIKRPYEQQQQFQVTPTIMMTPNMPNVQQYSIGQQTMPFYPPPSQALQSLPITQWPTSPTLLDPSMVSQHVTTRTVCSNPTDVSQWVLAMNGYQAAGVKLNAPGRLPFTNINRNRNQNKPQRHNSNPERSGPDSRLVHERPQSNSHRTSPRNSDSSQISSHMPFHSRRIENTNSHSQNTNSHSHLAHTTGQQHLQPQHTVDHNSNLTVNNRQSDNRQSDSSLPLSQRRSYRSRRRREDDVGRGSSRPNSSQVLVKDGKSSHGEPQFDLDPTYFPPLPGALNNTQSGDIFENKLSDVVKGTAKPLVRDTKTQTAPPATQPSVTRQSSKENTNSNADSSTTSSPVPSGATSVPTPPISPQKSHKATNTAEYKPPPEPSQPPPVVTSTSNATPTSTPVSTSAPPTVSTSSTSTSTTTTTTKQAIVSTQVKVEDKKLLQPVKLSYAQMVQKGREEAAAAANKLGTEETVADNDPSQTNGRSNQTLKEQSQTIKSACANGPSSAKDQIRKEAEPREQRFSARRAKENRVGRRRSDNQRDGPRSSGK